MSSLGDTGHNAWVVGNEPYTRVEFESMDTYAKYVSNGWRVKLGQRNGSVVPRIIHKLAEILEIAKGEVLFDNVESPSGSNNWITGGGGSK